jgi:hypothetical protein
VTSSCCIDLRAAYRPTMKFVDLMSSTSPSSSHDKTGTMTPSIVFPTLLSRSRNAR